MKYCPEIGKIYDTLFYCLEYYNEDVVKKVITHRFTDTSFMTNCHEEIREKIPSLPSILSPIFFCNYQKPCAISDFFDEQIDFENDNFDSFIRKITSKSEILYSKILERVFHDEQESDNRTIVPLIAPESYIEALTDSNYSENFKLQISLLFGNYNYAISVLTEQLRYIYAQVDALYSKYAEEINAEAEQIQSERDAHLYKQLLDLDINNRFFAISMLNQYITHFFGISGNEVLLLGYKHEEDLHLRFDEKTIDLRQLLIAVGNDTRYSVVQLFLEKEELTASNIAKILDLPPTTALRHVEFLYARDVLYISRRSGLQIFYKLNYNILKGAAKLIANKLGGKSNETNNKNDD